MRYRKPIACVLAALGLVTLAVGAALHWQVLHRLPQIPNSADAWHLVEWASWVAGVVSLLLSGLIALPVAVVTMIAAWQTRPSASDRHPVPIDPHVAREAEAADRLRAFLGRRDALPRMGDPSTQALALPQFPVRMVAPTCVDETKYLLKIED